MGRLALKLSLVCVAVALVAIAIVAVLVNQATYREFGGYLEHTRAMESQMGAMMGRGQTMRLMMGRPEQDFLQAVGTSLWIAGGIAVVTAVVLSLLLGRQITSPLRRLTLAAKKVASGDLSQRVEARGGDEIGELAQAFNTMAHSLAASEQQRRRLMADIAHELRTPLSVIQANLEAMMDGVVEASGEKLASVHQESLLLARLINDLRDVSLAEAGQLNLQRTSTDLGNLVRKAMATVEPKARELGICLEVEVPQGLAPVSVDADRIGQALRNLLDNALRYTPAQGTITVSVSATQRPGYLIVSVADTGSGIAEADLPHVFEHFYVADPSRQRRTGGSGIGLAVVKQLVEAHGGAVSAESTLGQGSTFCFTLPVA